MLHQINLYIDILNLNTNSEMNNWINISGIHDVELITLNENNSFKYEQISLVLLENTLIVFQESKNIIFNTIKNRLLKDIGRLRKKGIGHLSYGILDRIIDDYFIIVDSLSNRSDDLEETILSFADKNEFEKILVLKKDILKLKELMVILKNSKIKEFLQEDVGIFLED